MLFTAQHQTQIAQMLSAELTCAGEMRSILDQEHNALLQEGPDKITTITEQKSEIKNRMQRLLIQRDRFLRAISLPIGNAGTQKIIDQFPNGEAAKFWFGLMKLATELKEKNEINGGIVNLSLKHNQAALNIFTGQSTENDTYGPGGQSRKGTFHQTLAKA